MDTLLRFEILDLYAAYADCLDEARFEEWPEFFTDDCEYKLMPRENYDRGYPLATLSFESKGMLEDRVFCITKTLFHASYYQRHLIGVPRSTIEENGSIRAQANYLVVRTRQNAPSEVFNAGRYLDTIVRNGGELKFSRKLCIFDSELIPGSIVYPI